MGGELSAEKFLKKHPEFEIKVAARLIPFPLKLHTTPFNYHGDGQSITIELESEEQIKSDLHFHVVMGQLSYTIKTIGLTEFTCLLNSLTDNSSINFRTLKNHQKWQKI